LNSFFFTFEVSPLASTVGSLVILYTRETTILKSAEKHLLIILLFQNYALFCLQILYAHSLGLGRVRAKYTT
jgi:hypothetical protein